MTCIGAYTIVTRAMYLPCAYHVLAMYLSCTYLVLTMCLPCAYHVLVMCLLCAYHVLIVYLMFPAREDRPTSVQSWLRCAVRCVEFRNHNGRSTVLFSLKRSQHVDNVHNMLINTTKQCCVSWCCCSDRLEDSQLRDMSVNVLL